MRTRVQALAHRAEAFRLIVKPSHLIRVRPPLPEAVTLLQAASLPIEDLEAEALEHFFYAERQGRLVGLVGLELYGPEALLRSLVVEAEERGHGLGEELVKHAEAHARDRGVHAVFLLTTTAELFFRRLHYLRLDRAAAPPSIQRTREFADLCPSNSAFMGKTLDPRYS